MSQFKMLSAGALLLGLASIPAHASTIFSSADYNANEPGDFNIDNASFVGASFQLTQATTITGIGGHFSQYSYDNIFGAIVSASSLNALPTVTAANLASLALASTSLAPDGSDQLGSVSITLGPGTYDVIFGSGLWGTTGGSGLATGQTDNINSAAALFQTVNGGASWSLLGENDVRIDVVGTPVSAVPVPAALPLFASGLLGLMGAARRRRKA